MHFKPIPCITLLLIFQVVKIIGGGGKTICLPSPPRIDASGRGAGPPPTVGSFCIFKVEMVHSGGYFKSNLIPFNCLYEQS